jgi:hypothetical protein
LNALIDSSKSGSLIFSIKYLYQIRNKFGIILDSEDDLIVEKSIAAFKKQNNKNYYLFLENKYISYVDLSLNIFLHKDFKYKVIEFPKFEVTKIIN